MLTRRRGEGRLLTRRISRLKAVSQMGTITLLRLSYLRPETQLVWRQPFIRWHVGIDSPALHHIIPVREVLRLKHNLLDFERSLRSATEKKVVALLFISDEKKFRLWRWPYHANHLFTSYTMPRGSWQGKLCVRSLGITNLKLSVSGRKPSGLRPTPMYHSPLYLRTSASAFITMSISHRIS